jgi:hypothetical protein
MDGMKRAGFVVSSIAGSHVCQLKSVGPSEGYSLFESNQHTGRSLPFDLSGCDSRTCAWNFSAYQKVFGEIGFSYAFKITARVLRKFINIL